MPLYDYQCSSCGQTIEIRHGFNDTYAEPCAACGGSLTRVFNPAPILFKGSGFYITDSRGGAKSEGGSTTESSSSSKESAA